MKLTEYYVKYLKNDKKTNYRKYLYYHNKLKQIAGDIDLNDLTPSIYQEIIDEFAKKHSITSVHTLHSSVSRALNKARKEGLIKKDITSRVYILDEPDRENKRKYLTRKQFSKFLESLDLNGSINIDYFLYLIAKTGLRYSEAIKLTPKDFDFENKLLTVNKHTKKTRNRTIELDEETCSIFSKVDIEEKDEPLFKPIFIKNTPYNSYFNDYLAIKCVNENLPVISLHSLRHTHAMILIYEKISIESITKRLGNAEEWVTIACYRDLIEKVKSEEKSEENAKIINILANL